MGAAEPLAGGAMEDTTPDCAAFADAVAFLSYLKEPNGPHQQGKMSSPLDEVLLLCLHRALDFFTRFL
jgi:hypothetical protein